jgi:hypothetical protein
MFDITQTSGERTMTARLTTAIFAILLTASCITVAQPTTGWSMRNEIGQLEQIQARIGNIGRLIDRFVTPAESHGFNPQPDPPGRDERLYNQLGLLLPAVQRMLNFTYEQTGDARYLEILRLLEELQELLRQYEAAGDGSVRNRLAERMAVDMFRIQQILDVLEGELIGLL